MVRGWRPRAGRSSETANVVIGSQVVSLAFGGRRSERSFGHLESSILRYVSTIDTNLEQLFCFGIYRCREDKTSREWDGKENQKRGGVKCGHSNSSTAAHCKKPAQFVYHRTPNRESKSTGRKDG